MCQPMNKQCCYQVETSQWVSSQGQRHCGGPGGPCPLLPPPPFCVAKRKKRNKGKQERLSRQKPLKDCPWGQNRACRIQKFLFSASHGGRLYFPVFHGPSTLKSISPVLPVPIGYLLCVGTLDLWVNLFYASSLFLCPPPPPRKSFLLFLGSLKREHWHEWVTV